MSRKSKLSDKRRIEAVQEYLDGKGSYLTIAQKYGVSKNTIGDLVNRSKSEGINAIKVSSKNKKYDRDTKISAVEDYLLERGSQNGICIKYKISSRHTLRRWIEWYNRGNEFKERTRSERRITMKKGRNTTQEERAAIVAFCMENSKNYALTMKKYDVSYQQIYAWVKKYETKGVEGLSDRRGKAKPENELTEADRLRMENKILQAKLKDKEMEIELLKKLKELEGGAYWED